MQTQKHITDRSGIMLKYLAEALEGIYGSSAMGTSVLTEAASDTDDLLAKAKRPLPINTGLSTVYAASKAAADGRIGTRSIQDFNLNLNDKLTTLFRNAHYCGESYPTDANALRIKLLKLFPDDVSGDVGIQNLEVKEDNASSGVADIGEYVDTIVEYTHNSISKAIAKLVESKCLAEFEMMDIYNSGPSLYLQFDKKEVSLTDNDVSRSLFVHFYPTVNLTELESEISHLSHSQDVENNGDAIQSVVSGISSKIQQCSAINMVVCVKPAGNQTPIVRPASDYLGGFSVSGISGSIEFKPTDIDDAVDMLKGVIDIVSSNTDSDIKALEEKYNSTPKFNAGSTLTISDIDKIEADSNSLSKFSSEVSAIVSKTLTEVLVSERTPNKMSEAYHDKADKTDVAFAIAEIAKLLTPSSSSTTQTPAQDTSDKPANVSNNIANFYQRVSKSFKKQEGKKSLDNITPQVRAQIIKLCSPILSFIGSFNKHVIRGAYGMHVIDSYALSSITTGESARLNQKTKPEPAKLKDDLTSLVVHYEYALLRNRKDFVIESVYPIASPKPGSKSDSVLIGVRFPCFAITQGTNDTTTYKNTTRWLRVVFVLSPHAVRSADGKNAQATVSNTQVKDALFYSVTKSGNSYVPLISKAQLGSLITHNISHRLENGGSALPPDHPDYIHAYHYSSDKSHTSNTSDFIKYSVAAKDSGKGLSTYEKEKSARAFSAIQQIAVNQSNNESLLALKAHTLSKSVENLSLDEQDTSNITDTPEVVSNLATHVHEATKKAQGMVAVHSNMFLNLHSTDIIKKTKDTLQNTAKQQLVDSGLNPDVFDTTCEEVVVPGTDITAFETVSKLKEGVVFTDTDTVLSDTLSKASDIVLLSDVLQSPDANEVDATDELLLTLARHKGVKVPTEDGPKKKKLNKAWRGHVATSDEEFENDKALAQNDAQKNAFEVVSEVRKLHTGIKRFFTTMNNIQLYSHIDTYYALADRDPSDLHLSYAEDHTGLLTLNVEVLEAVVAVFTDAASKNTPSKNVVINILIKAVKEVLAIVKHLLGNKLWFDRNEVARQKQCANLVDLAKVIDLVSNIHSIEGVKDLVLSGLKQFKQAFSVKSFTVIPNTDENYNTTDGSLHVKTCSTITGDTDALELEPSIEEHGASITMAYTKSKKKHPVVVKNMASVLLPLGFPEALTSFTEVKAGIKKPAPQTDGLANVEASIVKVLDNIVWAGIHQSVLKEVATIAAKVLKHQSKNPITDRRYVQYKGLLEAIQDSKTTTGHLTPRLLKEYGLQDENTILVRANKSEEVKGVPTTYSVIAQVVETVDTPTTVISDKDKSEMSFVVPNSIAPEKGEPYLLSKATGKDSSWDKSQISAIASELINSKPGSTKYLQVLSIVYMPVNVVKKDTPLQVKLIILDRINMTTGRVEYSGVSWRTNSFKFNASEVRSIAEQYMTPIKDISGGTGTKQKKTLSYSIPLTVDNTTKLFFRALFSLSVSDAKAETESQTAKAAKDRTDLSLVPDVMKHYDGFDNTAISKKLDAAKTAYKKLPETVKREVREVDTPLAAKTMDKLEDVLKDKPSGN